MMSRARREVKLGLIGCGRVASERHLPVLRSLPDVEVIAAADINSDRLEQVADRFGIRQRYSNIGDLLNNSGIDAVAICAPPQVHVDIALAALEAEKHVFIEKPLALSLDDCDRLIERADMSGSKIMVGCNMRWHRLVRRAREIVQQGALGSLELTRTAFTSNVRDRATLSLWRGRREFGGGVLFEVAVHHFDLWRFLLGTEVVEVFATSRSESWDDETAVVTARLANGVLVTSLFSERSAECNEVEIIGDAGRLSVSCYRFDGLKFCPASRYTGDFRVRLRTIGRLVSTFPQVVSAARHGGDYIASYRAEWRHFIASIQQGTPVECTLDDGRRAVQIVLAALQSASEGRPVSVPPGSGGRISGPSNSGLAKSRGALGWSSR